MSNNDDPIKWNKKKKAERDEQNDLNRVKQIIGKIYDKWKTRLTKGQIHPAPLTQHFNDLKAQIFQALKDEGLSGFRQFTEELLNTKEKEVEAFQRLNDPSSPNYLLPSIPHAQPIPFHTESELVEIPIVKDYFGSPDFCGLVTKVLGPFDVELHALFEDGKDLRDVCIGRLSSVKGVSKLPTLREFVSALAKGRAEAAIAGTAQTPARSDAPAGSGPGAGTAPTATPPPQPGGTATGNSGTGPA